MREYRWTLQHREETYLGNKIDPYRITQGFGWNDNEIEDLNLAYSEEIEVSGGQVYQGNNGIDSNVFRYVAFYDFNGINTIILDGWRDNFTVPSGSYSCIVTIGSAIAGVLAKNVSMTLNLASEFVPYYTSRVVSPIYKKMARGYKLESGKQFYREKLDGNVKLIREDFDYIDALPFDTEFKLLIEDLTGILQDYRGLFFKTDCKWNEDDRIVELKMEPDDEYVDLLAGLEKTYNLVELEPEINELTLRKRPLIQVYIPGDTVVTNILGGTHWEQEIQTDPIFDHNTLISTYKFANPKNIRIVPSSYGAGLSTDITGEYDDDRLNVNGLYRLEEVTTGQVYWYQKYYQIVRVSDDVVLYKTENTDWRNTSVNSLVFTGVTRTEPDGNGGTNTITETGNFYFTEYKIYVRYYTDLLEIERTGQSPVSTYEVPSEDIVANNRNYRRIIGYNIDDFYIYDEFVEYPTKFGKVPDDAPDGGKYYKEFLVSVVTGLSNPLPVSSSNWKSVSLWFFNTSSIRYTEFIDGQDYTLRDSYTLDSVIDVLLREMGSTVRHKNTIEYSQVLYADVNPLGGFTYLDFDGGTIATDYSGNIKHFLTAKSNIIAGEYDQPSQKANASLSQILNMLRDCYRIFWHIENGKLRLEHITWYQNGGTYNGIILGADLTTLVQPKNGKNWSFSQGKYEYDKEEMPERFEFGWMDDVSAPFEGKAIEMVGNFVQRGRIEDMNVNGVTTDIDFIMANPQEISKDGFCLISTVEVDGVDRVPFIERDIGYNQEVIMQNGFLSWLYLHPKFHIYDLPSDKAIINGEEVTLFYNKTRQKKQEVTFPAQNQINPLNIIRTNLGDGIVDDFKIDMSSRIVKATIKHDNE